jgi:hypothetical protein
MGETGEEICLVGVDGRRSAAGSLAQVTAMGTAQVPTTGTTAGEGGERGRGERKGSTATCSMRWLRHVDPIDTSAKPPAKQL